ncbi:MAG TPA: DUF2971 domain-containing protein [Flavipsychrobacter sp.]|nr:DUF2971 domain-containing protein [Flavipsychrobacter sp.]
MTAMLDKQTKKQFCEQLSQCLKEIANSLDAYIDDNFCNHEKIAENISFIPSDSELIASFDPEYEYAFFRNIFHDERLDTFYHYTSFESLFHILSSGVLHLNALAGLNDRSEINYVNNYMGRQHTDPYNSITMAYHNYHFVFCFSKAADQLNQWRLYGDDGRGAMIEFSIDHNYNPYNNVLISKVYYDLKMFETLKEWQNKLRTQFNIGLGFQMVDYWKFFFKHSDYQDEREVRIMVRNTPGMNHKTFKEKFRLNRYGIIVPIIEMPCILQDSELIKIKNIILGPKIMEKQLNEAQIKYMMGKMYPGNQVRIETSKIDHYR